MSNCTSADPVLALGTFESKYHVDSVDVNASGKKMVIGQSSLEGNTWDGGLTLVSCTDGSALKATQCREGISMARFAGPLILTARDDGRIGFHSADNLDEVRKSIRAHDDIVSAVIGDPHHEGRLASCGWDGKVHVWDPTRSEQPVISYEAHYRNVNDIAYSQEDPALIASVGFDGFVRLWDLRLKPSTDSALVSNLGQIGSSVAFETSADRTILAGTDAGEVISIDFRSRGGAGSGGGAGVLHKQQLFRSRVRRIRSHSARKGLFVACSDDTTFAIFQHIACTDFHLKARVQTHDDYVADVAWVPNNSNTESADEQGQYDTFYSASTDKTVRSTQINVYSS